MERLTLSIERLNLSIDDRINDGKAMAIVPPSSLPKDVLKSLAQAITNFITNLQVTPKIHRSIYVSTSNEALLTTLVSLLQRNLVISTESTPDLQPPEFAKFGKLPLEIRLMIWKMAGSVGQVISVRTAGEQGQLCLAGTASRCPLLLTCSESRDEVMKLKGNFSLSDPRAPKIYANFSVDTIWIHPADRSVRKNSYNFHIQLGNIVGPGCNGAGVQRIVIEASKFYNGEWHTVNGGSFWLFMTNLKELVLVLREHEIVASHSRGLVGVDPKKSVLRYVANRSSEERNTPGLLSEWSEGRGSVSTGHNRTRCLIRCAAKLTNMASQEIDATGSLSAKDRLRDLALKTEELIEAARAYRQKLHEAMRGANISVETLVKEQFPDLSKWVAPRVSIVTLGTIEEDPNMTMDD